MFQLSELLLFPAHMMSVQVHAAALHTLVHITGILKLVSDNHRTTKGDLLGEKNAFCLCTGVTLRVMV